MAGGQVTMTRKTRLRRMTKAISKFHGPMLAEIALTRLRQVEQRPLNESRDWLPWYLLLIVKWAFEYGRLAAPARPAREQDLIELMNELHTAGDHSEFVGKGQVSAARFMMQIAHQQFWWQRRLANWTLGRHVQLFGALDDRRVMSAMFEAETGMKIEEFLELGVIVWGAIQAKPDVLSFTIESFMPLGVDSGPLTKFLSLVSRTPEELQALLSKRKRAVRSLPGQLLEQTPFVRWPIIRRGDRYAPVAVRVFEEALRFWPYWTLRDALDSEFTEEFGRVLERYVGQQLRSLGLPVKGEKDLADPGADELAVDFCVECQEGPVLLEVKSIQPSHRIKVHPSNELLASDLKSSVVKGVVQGFATAARLSGGEPGIGGKSAVPMLVIVTLGRLYMWNGGVAWDDWLGEAVLPKLEQRGIDRGLIPPGRIFVLSIDDFDWLVHSCRTLSTSPFRRLEDVVERNSELHGARFVIEDHLRADHESQTPYEPLHSALDDLWKRAGRRLQP